MPRKPIAPQVFLAGVPLFRELDAASLDRLAAGATRRPLKRGERLFRKGDRATGMYVVVFGEINLVATTPARGALNNTRSPCVSVQGADARSSVSDSR